MRAEEPVRGAMRSVEGFLADESAVMGEEIGRRPIRHKRSNGQLVPSKSSSLPRPVLELLSSHIAELRVTLSDELGMMTKQVVFPLAGKPGKNGRSLNFDITSSS